MKSVGAGYRDEQAHVRWGARREVVDVRDNVLTHFYARLIY